MCYGIKKKINRFLNQSPKKILKRLLVLSGKLIFMDLSKEPFIAKDLSQESTCVKQHIETVHNEKFSFEDETTEEATKIKFTIKKILELFRDLFCADACYLYLKSVGMDKDEKLEILTERFEEMKEAYKKEKSKAERLEEMKEAYKKEIESAGEGKNAIKDDKELLIPDQLYWETTRDFKILKFIDVSQREKEDGTCYWNFDYRNRPRKYVVFKKYRKIGETLEITSNQKIFNEGITAYAYRTKEPTINIKEELDKNQASASLNSRHKIKPSSACSIGIPLCNEKDAIGVLTLEFYDKKKEYDKNKLGKEVSTVRDKYLPLLVALIEASKPQFKKDSYDTLFEGSNLLNCLKELNIGSELKSSKINKQAIYNQKIYNDTVHLFYVLKRNEYVGYEEILGRVADYENDISKYLDISSGSKRFTYFLEKFIKHEELLLYGLSDFRDHFMHQFHVFVSGYIIINSIGFKEFIPKIEKSMEKALGKPVKISEFNVLRMWFLVSFFHDHAYIFEKIHIELENFFNETFNDNEKFHVNFNWEQLLKRNSKFPTHLTILQKFYSKQEQTNPDEIIKNYLDSIINTHDHGVLSALLLLNYFSEYNNLNPENGSIKDDCLYAAFAISVHNRYENLMENNLTQVSFESFPIAFLLSYCDTAQSFGRRGKRQDFPSRFLGIEFSPDRIAYKIQYLEGKKTPTPERIEKWAQNAHNTFKSSQYFFDIENYDANKTNICTLSYGFYRQPPSQSDTTLFVNTKTFVTVCPVNIEIGKEDIIKYCEVDKRGYPILDCPVKASEATVIVGIKDKDENNIKITKNDKVFICSVISQRRLSSVGKELAGENLTVIFHNETS